MKDLLIAGLVLGGLRRTGGDATINRLVALLLCLAAISALHATSVLSATYGFRNNFSPYLILIFLPRLLNEERIKFLTTAVILTGEVVSATAIFTNQFFGISWLYLVGLAPSGSISLAPATYFYDQRDQVRAFSPFVSPNTLATFTLLVVATVFSRADWGKRRKIASLSLPLLAIWLSGSRSCLLGLVVIGLVLTTMSLSTHRPTWRPSLIFILAVLSPIFALIAADLLSLRNSSSNGHMSNFFTTVQQIYASPMGIGLGQVGSRAARHESTSAIAESYPLALALEIGVLGCLVYLALMVYLALRLQSSTSPRSVVDSRKLGLLVLLSTALPQIVLPIFQEPVIAIFTWTLISIAMHGYADSTKQKNRFRPRSRRIVRTCERGYAL